jgi:ribosome maturation factor RimP
LIEPAVAALGYELLGVSLVEGGYRSTLRLYIDREAGISLEDCERVSHQVSGLLDVEDPLPGKYTLEVSSPGPDRPLFAPRHFEQYAGRQVKLKLQVPVAGRRRLRGTLRGMRDSSVRIVEEETEWLIPMETIGSARLVPEESMGKRSESDR